MQEINKIFQLHPDRNYSEASCILISGDDKKMDELLYKALYDRLKVKEDWITCNFQWFEKDGRKKLKLNPDYFSYPAFPVFSNKAVICLKKFFENGELLDIFLTSSNNEISHYNIFNNFNVFDCLDMKNSELKLNSNGLVEFFIKPIFLVDKIKAHIFKIQQEGLLTTFVTNVFVEKVLENKLVGFYFIPLYSIDGILGEPITTDYKKRRKKL